MDRQYPVDRLPLRRIGGQMVRHADPLDDQHPPLGLDLAYNVGPQPPAIGGDVTRFQRAGKGADQSAACGGDEVVQRGRMRIRDVGRHAIVDRHLAVDAEDHGLRLGRQEGAANLPFDPLDAHT